MRLDMDQGKQLISQLIKHDTLIITVNSKSRKLSISCAGQIIFDLRYPLVLGNQEILFSLKPESVKQIQPVDKYLILLIQAGAAAMACVDGDKFVHHKVIKTYLVRKKQGKSQL